MKNQLEVFRAVAAFFSQQMTNCEFVVHDLSNLKNSIIFIGNGHISGRQVGDSATDLVLRILRDKEYLRKDYTSIYRSIAPNGKVFNSSTFFIKEEKNLIGLLCINQDLTDYRNMYESLGSILALDTGDNYHQDSFSENLIPSMDSIPTNVIHEVLNKRVTNVAHLSKDERIDVVRELDRKGIFLLKGAITEVAKIMKISEATLYRYLQNLK